MVSGISKRERERIVLTRKLSPIKKNKMMSTVGASSKDEDTHYEAERAISGVRQKLSNKLSVEADVRQLIQQAMNTQNLSLLFFGRLEV